MEKPREAREAMLDVGLIVEVSVSLVVEWIETDSGIPIVTR